MQRLMSVLLVVGVAACGGGADGGSPNISDAPTGTADAGASSDGLPFQGLTVDWTASPALPGPLNLSTVNINVTSAKFRIEKLEAISDGGADPSTTMNQFDVLWNATTAPQAIYFFNAPPAIYSKIRLGLDKSAANAPSIEIAGTVVNNGTTEQFRITSTASADVEVLGYAVNYQLGDNEGMPIIVKLDAFLAEIDWTALPMTNNTRTLDDTRAADMTALLDRLELAFVGPLE
jgi:hypothetical protein